jgi:hypothetical protein
MAQFAMITCPKCHRFKKFGNWIGLSIEDSARLAQYDYREIPEVCPDCIKELDTAEVSAQL